MQDYADLDFDRAERCGFPEVIYGASKTPEQIIGIAEQLLERHGLVVATRVSEEATSQVLSRFPDARWFEESGFLFIDHRENPIEGASFEEVLACPRHAQGHVLVACAGTSDLAVAQEAALTARLMGSRVQLLADIGVAGVHRTLNHVDELRAAHVIVVVAGMEGALATLVAGLVDVPVVAVPTSVGYGASFGGIAALLSMLNSCAGGVSVVNIDNGFGAGQVAHRINCPPERFDWAIPDEVARWLSHSTRDFRAAAKELARKDRALRHLSQDRVAKIPRLLEMRTTSSAAAFLELINRQ